MEPMALGSPVNAASGTGAYPNQQQQSGAQYLPGFLMGDMASQVSVIDTSVCSLINFFSPEWWSPIPNQSNENDEGSLNIWLLICISSFSSSPNS